MDLVVRRDVFPGRSLRARRLTAAFLFSFGQGGSALFPFVTGVLASKVSKVSLHPITLSYSLN